RDGLNGSLEKTNSQYTPTNQELYAYIYYDFTGPQDLMYSMAEYTFVTCSEKLCPLLGWEGNSDLAGCVYLGVLASIRLGRLRTGAKDRSITSRGIDAIYHSTKNFLDASLFFCLAMLLAALFTFANAYRNPIRFPNTYSALTTVYMSLWSIIPTVLLHACISDQIRRKKWRIFSWVLISAIAIVVATLYLYIPHRIEQMSDDQYNKRLSNQGKQLIWEDFCLKYRAVYVMELCIKVLIGILFGMTLLYSVFAVCCRCFHPASRVRKYWWLDIAISCFFGMWTCLGFFIYFRRTMGQGGGASNKDHEWSFGQILGLATWTPVLIELAFIWKFGPKEAHTGQMINPYE
ncbi:hypothetical protein DM02DRAFT_484212, partial [Periconia macrospinosa]